MDRFQSNLFLNNVAQMFLKLESQLLLPATTVQYICKEMYNIYNEGQEVIKEKLKKCLGSENFSSDKINDVIKSVFDDHPMTDANKKLGTDHKRKKYFKKTFNYVETKSIDIDKQIHKDYQIEQENQVEVLPPPPNVLPVNNRKFYQSL